MTRSELVNAIIYECNLAFQKKDPKTGAYVVRFDMNDMYSEIYCLIDRYDRANAPKPKKRKKREIIVL